MTGVLSDVAQCHTEHITGDNCLVVKRLNKDFRISRAQRCVAKAYNTIKLVVSDIFRIVCLIHVKEIHSLDPVFGGKVYRDIVLTSDTFYRLTTHVLDGFNLSLIILVETATRARPVKAVRGLRRRW